MDFKNWCTKEIVCWLWDYETIPSLQTVNNYKTHLLAIEELKNRKISKEELNRILSLEEV